MGALASFSCKTHSRMIRRSSWLRRTWPQMQTKRKSLNPHSHSSGRMEIEKGNAIQSKPHIVPQLDERGQPHHNHVGAAIGTANPSTTCALAVHSKIVELLPLKK